MSSLSTLPKGDSAWLLRKSIQRIMQQVSVLETNIGSSTTGNSSNTQVIFNDNGTLRGDAGLTYNAATDTLSAGSATITGDLTVRTNGLTTTANAVGINTASPTANTLTIGASRYILCSDSQSKFGDNGIINGAAADANTQIQYFGGKALFFNEGVATRMTLNSTGLGVGVTPSAWASTWKAIQVGAIGSLSYSPDDTGYTISTSNGYWNGSNWIRIAAAAVSAYSQNQGKHSWLSAASSSAGSTIAFGDAKMTLDASGNLAIGVAATGTRRLEVKSDGTTNTTFAAHFRDSADVVLFSVRSDGYFNTGTSPLSPYNLITASAANMFVDSSGFVYRSTSSLKYKTDVKDSIHGLADVLKLRSVTYKSKNGDDTVFGGLIAEEVHAAGLTEFVAYAPDKTPDSINYGNMVALLVSAIKELTARVQTLEAK